MSTDEFLSTKALKEAISKRKKATDGEAVNWLKIRWIRFQRSKPFEIQFKHSFEKGAPFRIINLKQIEANKKRKNTKPQKGLKLKSLFEVKQEPRYPNRRAITVAKKNDMLSLLQFIPGCHHGYFKHFPVNVATRSKRPADINDEDDDNDEVIYE
ncbi:hypothetical protein J6590_084537 [Homalodisca vitripennis]|nr:hypothetical protein J6590_084537 [Homalodisca vitripennis]